MHTHARCMIPYPFVFHHNIATIIALSLLAIIAMNIFSISKPKLIIENLRWMGMSSCLSANVSGPRVMPSFVPSSPRLPGIIGSRIKLLRYYTRGSRVLSMALSKRSYSSESYPDEYSRDYVDTYYASPLQYLQSGFKFRWEQFYKFFGTYSCKWNNETARLLEFGGGPAITPLISAVPYVNQITFSAYLESERKEIELWKHDKEGARDWSSHFKYIVNEVEQIAGDDAWHEREEMLRKRITSIVPCDALNENPLLVKQDPFEIISTSLCLEPACSSYVQYKEAIKRLVGLLKPGGFFVMLVPERTTYYVVANVKWPCVYVTLEEVKEVLSEVGMAVVTAERDPVSMEQIQNPVLTDKKAYLFVAAQKVEF